MPTFEFATPRPVLATIGLDLGSVRISAGDRADTTVDLRSRDRYDPCGVATARFARVEYRAGELVVSAPKAPGLPGSGAVLIDIRLPSGSRLRGDALAADFHSSGRVGECGLTTGCGHIRLDRTGPLRLSSVLGNVTVGRVEGDVEAVAGCGNVAIHRIDGAADINRSTGNTRIGEIGGDLRAYADSGDLHIGRAYGAVEARAAQGDLRIDDVRYGPLVLETASGTLEVGIPDGVRAALDLDSHVGTVYRSLDLLAGAGPLAEPDEHAVAVHARTIIGDIVIRRAAEESEALDTPEGEWP